MNQEKELQELRQTVYRTSNGRIVCQHCKSCQTTVDKLSPILSPASPSSESYFSVDGEEGTCDDNVQENETRKDSTNLSQPSDITYFPHPDDPGVTFNVESNHDTVDVFNFDTSLFRLHHITLVTHQSRHH